MAEDAGLGTESRITQITRKTRRRYLHERVWRRRRGWGQNRGWRNVYTYKCLNQDLQDYRITRRRYLHERGMAEDAGLGTESRITQITRKTRRRYLHERVWRRRRGWGRNRGWRGVGDRIADYADFTESAEKIPA